MISSLRTIILRQLDTHRVMAIATNRPDGWPQATAVNYVNDGYLLYCLVARSTQKYANILRDPRISIAIGSDEPNPMDIKGLSLAGRAYEVADRSEFEHISNLWEKRHPEYAKMSRPTSDGNAFGRMPPTSFPASVVLLRIAPDVISVLDYSKGFGHSDLVTFSERDLDVHLQSVRHHWNDISTAVPAPSPERVHERR